LHVPPHPRIRNTPTSQREDPCPTRSTPICTPSKTPSGAATTPNIPTAPRSRRCSNRSGITFQGNERLNVYLTNSLEEAEEKAAGLFGPLRVISDEANQANKVKRDYPIMVVMGNPPYSGHSANKGKWIRKLIDDYKQVDGAPLGEKNPKWLNDDYVKFIRFGQWRIQKTGRGILAFITNHAWLDNPTFRGMRQQLMQTFDEIYIMDLHGSTKKKERCPDGSKDENVFDIQQGVAICLMVKLPPG
jgi:predicted helicase